MENGSVIIGTVKKFAIKLIDNSKKLINKKMLCWKKASYSPNNKQNKNNSNSNNNQKVTLTSNTSKYITGPNTLKSFRKKKPSKKKDSLTIQFTSNLK